MSCAHRMPSGPFLLSVVLSLFLGCGRCAQPPRRAAPTAPDAAAVAAPTPDAGARPEGFATPLTAQELASLPFALVYLRDDTGHSQLRGLDLRDGGDAALSEEPLSHFPAGVLPGGVALAVIETEQHGDQHVEQLLRLNPRGKAVVLHPPAVRARAPSFAPDGGFLIVESSAQGFSELWRISGDGRARRRLTDNPEGNFQPELSPDGRAVVFSSSRDGDPNLFLLELLDGGTRRLVASPGEDVSPKWSPTGEWIAFISSRAGEDQLFVVRPDGSGEQRLHTEPTPAKTLKLPEPQEKDPSWSPDGGAVLFAARPSGGTLRIYVARPGVGTREPLTDGRSNDDLPVWSPDGRYVAFTSTRDGQSEVYVMRADGSGQTRLTSSEKGSWLPMWVPHALLSVRAPKTQTLTK